ncbi:hypothetical protein AGMMS49942_03690 [Spirochaetia bacterium]|nr:hypothetical protein FACS189479_05110 [Spirochaetia bacterium]GHU97248.1 hypothetical protein FACS189483_02650 [Spirochaetia bacterium]GHV75548.1 hypothetical protein AGMMS49942_03690 [Spirochaetia bacterium]
MGYSVSPAKGGKVAVYQGGRKVREFLAESDAWAWIARQVRAGK